MAQLERRFGVSGEEDRLNRHSFWLHAVEHLSHGFVKAPKPFGEFDSRAWPQSATVLQRELVALLTNEPPAGDVPSRVDAQDSVWCSLLLFCLHVMFLG